ncbi:hypothetical protein C8J57DRAFT_1493446 [Mycena rebaudengoi]|nr:hypothetical protein C8J57DRAFT_1493446 [Mycena rebaudengoi]
MLFKDYKMYPSDTGPMGVLIEMDYVHQAVWYNPSRHWWPFNPTGSPPGDEMDSLAYIFDYTTSVNTREATYMAYDSDGHELGERWAGCFLDKAWTERCVADSQRLGLVCAAFTKNNEYGSLSFVGNSPAMVVRSGIENIFSTEAEALRAAALAKRTVLSQLGYIPWYISCRTDWARGLAVAEAVYVTSLRLDERQRRGVLVDVDKSWMEMNIPHWIRQNVAVHYPWTREMDKVDRFLRLSPVFLKEYFAAIEANGGVEVPLESLVLYHAWGQRLARFDVYLRDSHAAKLGRVRRAFRPHFAFKIVDKLYWGPETSLPER